MLSKPVPVPMIIAQTLAPTLVPPAATSGLASNRVASVVVPNPKPKTLQVKQDPENMWNPTLCVCEQVLANAKRSILMQSRFESYKYFVIRSLMVKMKLKPEDRSMQFLLPNSFTMDEAHEILARVAHLVDIVPSSTNPMSFVVRWEHSNLLRNALHLDIAVTADLILRSVS